MTAVTPPEGYLSGAQLDPYKDKFDGRCWWCKSTADSKEHKFKRSDLHRMWGNDDYLLKGDNSTGALRRINGPNARAVKFEAFLCARCNNQRSQPFDYAYDRFADYVWGNLKTLWYRRSLNFGTIYGSTWAVDTESLARYVIKHAGCRMWDAGFAPPAVFSRFLDGTVPLVDTSVTLVKDPYWWGVYKRTGKKYAGLDISQTTGEASISQQRLTSFFGSLSVGYIGFRYGWRDNWGVAESFFGHRKVAIIDINELGP